MRDKDEDLDFAQHEGEDPFAPPAAPRRSVSVWAGAGLAVVLLAGIGWWVWDLGTREPAEVPVIAAASGLSRVADTAPDPGTEAAHQDISSYEAATTPDVEGPTKGLAPETEPPSEEDISLRDLEDILGVPTPRPASLSRPTGPAGAPAAEPAPVAALPPEPRPGAEAATEPAPAEDATGLAPSASPVAPPRPDNLPQRMAAAEREAAADVEDLRRRAATSPFQLQLGAYRSEEQTRAEWDRIARAHPELLNNRALAIQSTQSGGQTYYRLRVGPFSSMAEAASLCEALGARGQACLAAQNY